MSRSVYIVSLGCPKNLVDSEIMIGELEGAGHRLVERPEDAEAIVVNTCGFIDAAKEESIDTILEMASYKDGGRCQTLVVTGCLTQRYPDEVAAEIPEIDHLLGSADISKLRRALAGERRQLPVIDVAATPTELYDHRAPRVVSGSRHSTYLKIAEGCDRPCSFCIIPKLRGPQRSRSIDSILEEAARLVDGGARELNLIAQDLTRYGHDLAERPSLAALLRRLTDVDGLDWIRLHYTYPTAITDELIEVIAGEPRVLSYVDVPLQHIDDELLKRMRRGHSARVTRELIERLRAAIDDLILRTTFIVGHPGETDEAFSRLEDFVTDVEFDRVGVFTYSQEPGTVSALLPNRVPAEVALERQERLMEIQRRISRSKLESMIGKEIEVLVDGISSESELLLEGRYYGQAPGIDGVVYLADGSAAPGDLVRARVTDAADYDLAASLSQLA
jgi:ribosomal protein S12 methylthiotransferase